MSQLQLGKDRLSALRFWPMVKLKEFEEVMLGRELNILRGHFIVTGLQCVLPDLYQGDSWNASCLLLSFFLSN